VPRGTFLYCCSRSRYGEFPSWGSTAMQPVESQPTFRRSMSSDRTVFRKKVTIRNVKTLWASYCSISAVLCCICCLHSQDGDVSWRLLVHTGYCPKYVRSLLFLIMWQLFLSLYGYIRLQATSSMWHCEDQALGICVQL
jgi:hypothetical protein